jgi:hypothetical protein
MEQQLDFEEISYRNRVLFFSDDLVAFHKGELPITDLCSGGQRKAMRDIGIIQGHSWNSSLSDRTIEILEEYEEL